MISCKGKAEREEDFSIATKELVCLIGLQIPQVLSAYVS